MDAATAHQRTMKDFLELYNKMVYHCFDKCVSNFNQANASAEETECVNVCADKSINFNQRHMTVFVQHQSSKQKLAAKAAEEAQTAAATSAPALTPDTPALPAPAADVKPEVLAAEPSPSSLPQTVQSPATVAQSVS